MKTEKLDPIPQVFSKGRGLFTSEPQIEGLSRSVNFTFDLRDVQAAFSMQ